MLIAIEGIDGSGKTTQVNLLRDFFVRLGLQVHVTSFPRYQDKLFGDLIRRLLAGDLGDAAQIHPQLTALLFAGDRAAAAPMLRQALYEDRIVLCDRYVYSNLAYQGARLGEPERDEFWKWVRKLEFGHYAMPVPTCSIFIDVHAAQMRGALASRDRDLANTSDESGAVPNDVYERDVDYQSRVESVFRDFAEEHEDLLRVDGMIGGTQLPPHGVHESILSGLSLLGLIDGAQTR